MDGFDFHVVSLSVTSLAAYYKVSKTDVTGAITLTLLFRSLGAAIFGIAGDYWGRKYPMVINMIIVRSLSFGLTLISNNSTDRGYANVGSPFKYLTILLRMFLKCHGLRGDIPRISSGQGRVRYRHGRHLGECYW